jgi:hypothetical protein
MRLQVQAFESKSFQAFSITIKLLKDEVFINLTEIRKKDEIFEKEFLKF